MKIGIVVVSNNVLSFVMIHEQTALYIFVQLRGWHGIKEKLGFKFQ